MRVWDVLKDILLTGAGVFLILSQVTSLHPSDALIVAGLALTSPSLADHAKAVISGSPTRKPADPPASEESETPSAS